MFEKSEKRKKQQTTRRTHANKDSENRKRQKVTDLDEKHGR
jgi:hypothetical protein